MKNTQNSKEFKKLKIAYHKIFSALLESRGTVQLLELRLLKNRFFKLIFK